MKQKALEYFDAWNSFDGEKLRDTLHSEVVLSDWLTTVSGIQAVLEVNQRIQAQFSAAKIEVIDLGVAGPLKVLAQINIKLAAEHSLNVVDVLEFKDDKIVRITAYKQ